MERQSKLVYVLMIFLVLQVLTIADALKYADDDNYRNEEYHIEDDDNGMRKSSLTIGAREIGGDNGNLNDSEYLRHTIKTLRVDVSSLRRAVRVLYKDELSAIRKGVELLDLYKDELSTIRKGVELLVLYKDELSAIRKGVELLVKHQVLYKDELSTIRKGVELLDLYKDELSTIRKGVELLVKHQIGEEMLLKKPSRRIVDIVGNPQSLEGFSRNLVQHDTVYAPGFTNYRPSTNVPSEEGKQDQYLDGYLHEQFGGQVWPFSAYDFGQIRPEYISK